MVKTIVIQPQPGATVQPPPPPPPATTIGTSTLIGLFVVASLLLVALAAALGKWTTTRLIAFSVASAALIGGVVRLAYILADYLPVYRV